MTTVGFAVAALSFGLVTEACVRRKAVSWAVFFALMGAAVLLAGFAQLAVASHGM
jgi:hypothetical protein